MKSPLLSLLLVVALLLWGAAGAWAGPADPAHMAESHAAGAHAADCGLEAAAAAAADAMATTATDHGHDGPGGLLHGCCLAACSVVMDAVAPAPQPAAGRLLAVFAVAHDDAASLPSLPLRRPPKAHA